MPAGGRLAGRLPVVACLRATACGRLPAGVRPAQASGRRRVRAGGTDHSVGIECGVGKFFSSAILLPVLQSHHCGMGVRTVN
jgi:hypothetical protein